MGLIGVAHLTKWLLEGEKTKVWRHLVWPNFRYQICVDVLCVCMCLLVSVCLHTCVSIYVYVCVGLCYARVVCVVRYKCLF